MAFVHKKIETYLEYKDAIDTYFYEERRWGKKAKPVVNAISPDTSDEHSNDVSEEEDPAKWTESLMQQINALVHNKLTQKGKGKGKGDRGKNNYTPMDVDTDRKDGDNAKKNSGKSGGSAGAGPGNRGRAGSVPAKQRRRGRR